MEQLGREGHLSHLAPASRLGGRGQPAEARRDTRPLRAHRSQTGAGGESGGSGGLRGEAGTWCQLVPRGRSAHLLLHAEGMATLPWHRAVPNCAQRWERGGWGPRLPPGRIWGKKIQLEAGGARPRGAAVGRGHERAAVPRARQRRGRIQPQQRRMGILGSPRGLLCSPCPGAACEARGDPPRSWAPTPCPLFLVLLWFWRRVWG